MKAIALFYCCICLCLLQVAANDGVYLSSGGMIYPTKETKISIEKEMLSFTVRDAVCDVNIYFEFNNPESTNRTLLVGFQAPTPQGDIPDVDLNKNLISNFIIMSSGSIIPYEEKYADCTDCPLQDPSAYKSEDGGGLFIYLFEITFKPGKNIIQHSYSFPASSSIEMDQMYDYVISTGGKWAGGVIKELYIQFNLGDNTYFYVDDVFPKSAQWNIVGTGLVTDTYVKLYNDINSRMIRIISGHLEISINNFTPQSEIAFGIINSNSFICTPLNYNEIIDDQVVVISQLPLSPEYTLDELKLLRNTVYAQHGYLFQNEKLLQYFEQFDWYIPNPNLPLSDIILSVEELQYVNAIIEQEANLKK
jgi:hypothetical protein